MYTILVTFVLQVYLSKKYINEYKTIKNTEEYCPDFAKELLWEIVLTPLLLKICYFLVNSPVDLFSLG